MENNAVVTRVSESKPDYYKEMLAKRIRPKVTADKLNMNNDQSQITPEAPVIHEFSRVVEESTRYFNGDSLAANVWANKYALKNSEGHLFELTPDDMHRRIARELARIEKKYPNPMSEEEIFSLMQNFRYIIPQGSPWPELEIITRSARFPIVLLLEMMALPILTAPL
jgi:ribonucleoside-diphosphate reductase alpha chain